jgi:hypothetical protein
MRILELRQTSGMKVVAAMPDEMPILLILSPSKDEEHRQRGCNASFDRPELRP